MNLSILDGLLKNGSFLDHGLMLWERFVLHMIVSHGFKLSSLVSFSFNDHGYARAIVKDDDLRNILFIPQWHNVYIPSSVFVSQAYRHRQNVCSSICIVELVGLVKTSHIY